MKWVFKLVLFLFGLAVAGAVVLIAFIVISNQQKKWQASDFDFGPAPNIQQDGHTFRDLNKNGKLDDYENNQLPIEIRVEDLLKQMTLEEKAAQLFHPFLFSSSIEDPMMKLNGYLNPEESIILTKGITHVLSALTSKDAAVHAGWANDMQAIAERTRLGIPLTISSDPRHSDKIGASAFMPGFSQWPDPLGFGALQDSALVYAFADIARQEYRAVGIHAALHPTVDLATEPRWARIASTFGEDAALTAKLAGGYILGFQGDTLGPTSVATMTKHFSGGGPQKDGWDAHFKYGKDQVYPGNNASYHLIPFEAAINAGAAQIMPYYGIPQGLTHEDVGFAFNKYMIQNLLKDSLGFDGIICSDWMILSDVKAFGKTIVGAKDHGVEDLSVAQKIEKALQAGIDQFGGEQLPELVVPLVREGKIKEDRIDSSVRKLLRQKFFLGLFDNPYVDVEAARKICKQPEWEHLGFETMVKSSVLLKNEKILPLEKDRLNVYTENIDAEILKNYVISQVDQPSKADVAIINLPPPFEPRDSTILESLFHQGTLAYSEEVVQHIQQVAQEVPTVVTFYFERPPVMPEISAACQALVAHFSISQKAMVALLFGEGKPEGKLPVEMPSSMEAVGQQLEDLPHDSKNPLYPFGHGLNY